jgi:hypothetical protein
MLTDAALRSLAPKEKAYKVADRDGLYVYVLAPERFRFGTTIRSMADKKPLSLDVTDEVG